ncbi:hypothetical protein MT997_32765 [Paenibacillus sp. OVF10]|nr:hypothetical protein MT997_32765 [Paenibacillus sp. OVF10]
MTYVTVNSFNGVTSKTYEYPMILHELAVFNGGQEPLTVTVCTQKRELDTFQLPLAEPWMSGCIGSVRSKLPRKVRTVDM